MGVVSEVNTSTFSAAGAQRRNSTAPFSSSRGPNGPYGLMFGPRKQQPNEPRPHVSPRHENLTTQRRGRYLLQGPRSNSRNPETPERQTRQRQPRRSSQ